MQQVDARIYDSIVFENDFSEYTFNGSIELCPPSASHLRPELAGAKSNNRQNAEQPS